MSLGVTVVSFGEWLPDQPDLGNSGLTVASNVIPANGSYAPFKPLTPVLAGNYTLPATPRGGFVATDDGSTSFPYWYYAATGNVLYMATGGGVGGGVGGSFTIRSAGLSTVAANVEVQFAQFDSQVFAARRQDGLQVHTVGSASNFSVVPGMTGTNDPKYVWTVGRFLVVGNLGSATTRPSTIKWSSVDDPDDFPTPNSATAIARQSGEQILNTSDGEVLGGFGTDQYGVVIQRGAITRMTYVGPPVVFQFDRLDISKGSARRYASAYAANSAFILASDGMYRTDGVSLTPIGVGKVDETFLAADPGDISLGEVNPYQQTEAGFDPKTNCVVFATANNLATLSASRAWLYSVDQNKWTSCDQVMRCLIDPSPVAQADGLLAFDSNNVLCKFSGTPGTALLTTGDVEINPGGRAFVGGVKPNVESTGTAPTVTVRLGYRDLLSSASTYTATTTPTTRTGIADFRVDAKYHRAEVQVVGAFTKATGLEFIARDSGTA